MLSFTSYDISINSDELPDLEKGKTTIKSEQRGDTLIAYFKEYYIGSPTNNANIIFKGDTLVLSYCESHNMEVKSEGVKLMNYRIFNPTKKKYHLINSFIH